MATERHVVWICDLCNVEDEDGKLGVKTRTQTQGTAIELDACDGCWKPFAEAHAKLVEVGRKPARKAA